MSTLRLVQLNHPARHRCVAVVEEPVLRLLTATPSIYHLALRSVREGISLSELVASLVSAESLDYSFVYEGRSEWRLLPAFDQPENPFGCLVSGTGLTHKNSALNRQMMHQSTSALPASALPASAQQTDSMRMYQWGLEGGFPGAGGIGVQPEWFYKGNSYCLLAHNEALEIPAYGDDGGEEPEIAGIYIVDDAGIPRRIGLTTANEFSDHVMEKKNYLYLAPSKLRSCAIGPELVVGADFDAIAGTVGILRDGVRVWETGIHTGEKHMAHSLGNLEHHHFKYASHRIPLQTHVHFFGADAFSFGSGFGLLDGDVMEISWEGMGRPLRNPLKQMRQKQTLVKVVPL